MRLTNHFNMPEVLVSLAKKELVPRDIDKPLVVHVSDLPTPTRMKVLRDRYGNTNRFVRDVSEILSTLPGSGVHEMLEKVDGLAYKSQHEVNLKKEFKINGKVYTLSGTFDHFNVDKNIMWDWKTAKTAMFTLLNTKEDYIKQMNVYRYLQKELNNIDIDEMYLGYIFLDYAKARAVSMHTDILQADGLPNDKGIEMFKNEPIEGQLGRRKTPASQFYTYKVPMIPLKEVEAYIVQSIECIDKYRDVPDDKLPMCTDKDRWYRSGGFAVHKKGLKRARRILNTRKEAEEYIAAQFIKTDLYIEERAGVDLRCLQWCQVGKSGLCSYYNEHIGSGFRKNKEEDYIT